VEMYFTEKLLSAKLNINPMALFYMLHRLFASPETVLKDLEKNKIKTSCTVFSGEKSLAKYGIQTCAIDCKKPCNQIMINGAAGIKTDSGQTGKYDVTFLANDLVEGQLCLIN